MATGLWTGLYGAARLCDCLSDRVDVASGPWAGLNGATWLRSCLSGGGGVVVGLGSGTSSLKSGRAGLFCFLWVDSVSGVDSGFLGVRGGLVSVCFWNVTAVRELVINVCCL